jgi:hypothetical protein
LPDAIALEAHRKSLLVDLKPMALEDADPEVVEQTADFGDRGSRGFVFVV